MKTSIQKYSVKRSILKTVIMRVFLGAVLTLSFNINAQNVGINATGTAPDNSALLDLSSDSKGFLITRVEPLNIVSPAFGLMTLAPSDSCLYIFSGATWISLGGVGSNCPCSCSPTQPAALTCGSDNITAVVEVVSTTGKIWMDRNLGASQVATSSDDAAAYGDLYQWGRCHDGHEKRTSTTVNTSSNADLVGHSMFITSVSDWRSPQNDNLWQGVTGLNNPCPSGYRLPTYPELDAEKAAFGTFNQNAAAAFSSPLKLPAAGSRKLDGSTEYVGSFGYYWTSTIYNVVDALYLEFQPMSAIISFNQRGRGFSVRCIKDY